MESVIADIDPRNWRSRKCLEGVGFVETRFEERTAELGGEWVDSAFLGGEEGGMGGEDE